MYKMLILIKYHTDYMMIMILTFLSIKILTLDIHWDINIVCNSLGFVKFEEGAPNEVDGGNDEESETRETDEETTQTLSLIHI